MPFSKPPRIVAKKPWRPLKSKFQILSISLKVPAMPFAPKLAAHGAEIPAIGFGTSGLGDVRAEHIATALKAGYRHIDTARKYGTERVVGEGIRASGIAREEIFLCTKVSHENLHAGDFARS